MSWQRQSTFSTENITSNSHDTKIISKPPYMDCMTREMTEIELHPNHKNRGLPHLGQIIETSHSLLRKWRKPSHDDTSAFLRATNWFSPIHFLRQHRRSPHIDYKQPFSGPKTA